MAQGRTLGPQGDQIGRGCVLTPGLSRWVRDEAGWGLAGLSRWVRGGAGGGIAGLLHLAFRERLSCNQGYLVGWLTLGKAQSG